VRRVIHPAGIIFKGSGWYITDSRKSPPAEGSTGESSGPEKPAEVKGGDTKAGDAKPAETKGSTQTGSGPKEAAS
jgi:hypothetical protein